MAKRFLLTFLILVVVSSFVLLFGCFGSKAVTIGVAVPLSGEDKDEGESIVNAVQLCVDEWNAQGGLFGKPIKIITKDDKENSETALMVASELCKEKVSAVIGHYTSACTIAGRDKYFENRILMITPSSTNPAITDGIYPTIFRVCGRDDAQGVTAAQYVYKAFPDAKVALLHDESRYGKDLSDRFLSEFSSLSKSESVLYKHFDRSIADFSQIAMEIKEKGATVVYFGGLFTQGAELLKAIRKEGSTATFVSGDGCYHPLFIEKATPQAAEGSLVTFAANPEGTPEGKAFVKKYKATFGKDPKPYSLYAYSATYVALKAMQKANTKESVAVSAVIHSETFDTPIGILKFDKKGDPESAPWSMWKVQNGAFVPAPNPEPAVAPQETMK
jgi:branched-chain amino acid transport system substrate-binding protein